MSLGADIPSSQSLKAVIRLIFCADASYDALQRSLQSESCCPTLCSAPLIGWIEQVLGICATYLVDYGRSYQRCRTALIVEFSTRIYRNMVDLGRSWYSDEVHGRTR